MSVEKRIGEAATGGGDFALPPANTLDIIPKTRLARHRPLLDLQLHNLCSCVSVNASSATNRDAISIFLHGRTELVVIVIWFTL